MKTKILLILMAVSCIPLYGGTLEEAKKVYLSGNYEAALPLLEEQYKKNKRNASVNQWIGVCLFNLGRYEEGRKYFEYAKSKKVVEAYRYLAMLDFYAYRFDEGSEMFDQYRSELKRIKKEVSEDAVKVEQQLYLSRKVKLV